MVSDRFATPGVWAPADLAISGDPPRARSVGRGESPHVGAPNPGAGHDAPSRLSHRRSRRRRRARAAHRRLGRRQHRRAPAAAGRADRATAARPDARRHRGGAGASLARRGDLRALLRRRRRRLPRVGTARRHRAGAAPLPGPGGLGTPPEDGVGVERTRPRTPTRRIRRSRPRCARAPCRRCPRDGRARAGLRRARQPQGVRLAAVAAHHAALAAVPQRDRLQRPGLPRPAARAERLVEGHPAARADGRPQAGAHLRLGRLAGQRPAAQRELRPPGRPLDLRRHPAAAHRLPHPRARGQRRGAAPHPLRHAAAARAPTGCAPACPPS